MSDLIRAGILGGLTGAALGAPLRGRTSFTKLAFYDPIPRRMPAQDALDAWLVWAEHLDQGKRPGQLTRTFHGHATGGRLETAFGLLNANRGLSAPLSGSYANPLAGGSLAIGRAVYWGLAFHGDPDEAARWAWHDASIDHDKEGVWTACMVARMTALAHPGTSIAGLIRDSAAVLPKESAFFSISSRALKSRGDWENSRTAFEALASQMPDIQDARRAMAVILFALLLKKEGFGPGILFAAGCGGPSDQAALAVGVITGLLNGEVPKEWLDPLGKDYIAGHVYRAGEAPATIPDFVKQIAAACPDAATPAQEAQEAPTDPEPAPDESAPSTEAVFEENVETAEAPAEEAEPEAEAQPEEASEAVEEPVEAELAVLEAEETVPTPALPAPSAEIVKLLAGSSDRLITEAGGLRIEVDYLNGATAKEEAMQVILRLANQGDAAVDVSASLDAPKGWNIRTRVQDAVIPPHDAIEFPNVMLPPGPLEHDARAPLELQGAQISVPLLAAEQWSVVGPFVNHEGTGFDHVYGPEKGLDPDGIYNGRSDLAIKWENKLFEGGVYDVEPLFKTGPGVAYLCAYIGMPKAGPYQVIASASTGVVVWVGNSRIVRYHSEHLPSPHAQHPYVGSATWEDRELPVLIKLIRNRRVLEPFVLYFLNEDGAPVRPASMRPLA